MANVVVTGGKFSLSTANGTNAYVLGDGSGAFGSAIAVQVVDTGALSASISVTARSRVRAAADDAVAFVAIPYKKLWLNGVAGDNTYVSTAITTHSLIVIPASGLSIALNVTFTSGTATIYWTPVESGAAA